MSSEPSVPAVVGGSPFSILKSVEWCRRNNLKPVPLAWAKKNAVQQNWNATDWVPPPDSYWQQNLAGVGVKTGATQGGLVDTDKDCQEAIFLCPYFFPPTSAVFGRLSKPDSHSLYKVDEPNFDTKMFIDPVTRHTIIELRGGTGGAQTVLPGNIHDPTGEEIKWSSTPYPEITSVPYSQLLDAAKKVAIATVISRYCWDEGYHNEPTKHLAGMFCRLEWPLEETKALIAAVMEMTGDKDKSRLPTIEATYRRFEAGKKVSGANVLRKQINNDPVVDYILEQAGHATINLLNDYNDRFGIVMLAGKFRIAVPQPRSSEVVFMQKGDFLDRYAIEPSGQMAKGGRSISKAEIWLGEPRRRTYDAADFMPGVDDDGEVFNLWTGWGCHPSDNGSCDAWLELVHQHICQKNDEAYHWLLHWFASIVREPMNKPHTCPVIIGREGTGKSLMIDYYKDIIGGGYQVVTKEDQLVGKFNAYMQNCLLLHSEEATFGGDKKHAGIIRSFITDEVQRLEKKGVDSYQIKNHARLIITTNNFNAASVAVGDRRYSIFDMGWAGLDANLRDAVLKERKEGGPAALFKYLLDMQYDPKLARTNLKNEALATLKGVNASPIDSWWHDVLMEGQLLPDYALCFMKAEEGDLWANQVGSTALFTSMICHLRARGTRTQGLNPPLFMNQLCRMTGRKGFARGQRSYSPILDDRAPREMQTMPIRQASILDLPDLPVCRKAFEEYLGSQLEWPEDEKPFDKQRRADKKLTSEY